MTVAAHIIVFLVTLEEDTPYLVCRRAAHVYKPKIASFRSTKRHAQNKKRI
jgi:hypothetical protein